MEIFTPRLTTKYFLENDDLIGEKCRTCLKKTSDIWQVFQSDGEISSRIMACAAVQVHEGDGLPNVICYSCRELLDISYNFKCQVEKTDAKFRETFKTPEIMFNDDKVAQPVNAVITEAISDEISNKQMRENEVQTNESAEQQYQPEGYLRMNNSADEDEDDDNGNNDDADCAEEGEEEEDEGEEDDEDEDEDKDDNNDGDSDGEEENSIQCQERAEGKSMEDEKKSLIITPYVESSGMFVETEKFEKLTEDMKFKSIDEADENYRNDKNHVLSDRDGLQQEVINTEEKPFYLVLTKNNSRDERKDIEEHEGSEKISEEMSEINVKPEETIGCETVEEIDSHRARDVPDKSLTMEIHDEIAENKTKYRYVCYMCEQQFVSIEKLKSHVANDHNSEKDSESVNRLDDNFPCEENKNCMENDASSTIRKKKIKFSCKYCPKQFTYEKSFSTHAKQHPEYIKSEKSVGTKEKCDERRFHNDSEDDDMPLEGLQCTQCGKLFATKRNLKRHISTHSGLKFNCPTCQKEFSRADKLKEHEQSKHSNEFFALSDEDNDTDSDNQNKRDGDNPEKRKKEKNHKPHQCPMCPRSFAHSQTLTNHVERHKRIKQPQKRFLCEVCSKCFAQSGSLVAHMRTHTGVKPYVCNVCSRAFTKSTYLQLHLRTHSGEKPYICQYCSRAFARANTLARHITMHTGEAKYHCQICMKSFRRLTSLNEHTYTHTGQRPYACKICTKRYNNAGSLYAHTKKCKAQQLSSNNSNYPLAIETTNLDDPTTSLNNQPSTMLIYAPKKSHPEIQHVNSEATTLPEFILPNIQPEKSLSPDLVQPVSTDDSSNLYSVNTKQFKSFYYTTYPTL
ncbi:zinc finger protein 436 [Fopius arisanus]|uniref:ZNF251_1 protein n=2 Tax=Fopius arisanus TaxID=64838 RepID=A0A0C9R790_9HYME|nr:PREDICTED: zinc finger protein 436-like [Fopius arisanus]